MHSSKRFIHRVPPRVNLTNITLLPETFVPICPTPELNVQNICKTRKTTKRIPRVNNRTLVEVSPATASFSTDASGSDINCFPSKKLAESISPSKSHPEKSGSSSKTASTNHKFHAQAYLKSKKRPSRLNSRSQLKKSIRAESSFYKPNSPRNYHRRTRYNKKKYQKGKMKKFKKSANDVDLQQQSTIFLDSKQKNSEIEAKEKDFKSVKDVILPVGFRKYTVQYLRKRKHSFFKPKFYYICSKKTVIKCLNKEKTAAVPDVTEVDSISEEEYEMETEVLVEDYKNEVSPDGTLNEPNPELALINSDVESEEVLIIEEFLSGGRTYRKCIPDNPDFYQGETLIQKDIDIYKSHLIGLGYIVEIREKNDETNAIQHRCILCAADIHAENDSGEMVITHVSSFNHMFKYLEKHFPSCGFNFSDSVENSSKKIVLQKICEEISSKLGYDCMSVTDDDYFAKENEHIIKVINDIPHWCESDISINLNSYVKELDNSAKKSVSSYDSETKKDISPHKLKLIQINETNGESMKSEQVSENTEKSMNTEQVTLNDKEIIKNKQIIENDKQIKKPKQVFEKNIETKKFNAENLKNRTNYRPGRGGLFSLFNIDKPIRNKSNYRKQNKVFSANDEDTDDIEIVFVGPKSKNTDVSTLKIRDKTERANSKDIEKNSVSIPSENDQQSNKVETKNISIAKVSSPGKRSTNSPLQKQKLIAKKASPKNQATNSKEGHCMDRVPISNEASNPKVIDSESNSKEMSNKPVELVPEKWKVALSNLESLKGLEKESSHNSNISISSTKIKKSVTANTNSNQAKNQRVSVQPSAQAISTIITHSNAGRAGIAADLEQSPLNNKDKTRPKTHSKHCIKRILSRSKIQKESLEDDSRESTHSIISATHSHRSRSPFKSHRSFKSPLKSTRMSPKRRSRSPLRRLRSPSWSRSNLYRKRSRSPFKRHSRSPFRRHSRSPNKRYSRSPSNWHSRSPFRRYSRSPVRRYSRSPSRRYSKSPSRRYSRSPVKRYSRSPIRKYSRSPVRRYSRSPIRKRSRSPVRRYSKSPIRKHSRSPFRRYSRSPVRRYSKSPARKQARSPLRRYSRSPIRRHSKSPLSTGSRKMSRSPLPNRAHLSRAEFEKNVLRHQSISSEQNKHSIIQHSKMFTRSSDLEPVSDEDESLYFNTMDKAQNFGDFSKLPESTRSVMTAMFKKFLATEGMKPGDSSLLKFMQFMDAGSSNVQTLNSTNITETNSPNLQRIESIPHLGSFQQPHLPPNVLNNPQFHSGGPMPHSSSSFNPKPTPSYLTSQNSSANFMPQISKFMPSNKQQALSQSSYPHNQQGILPQNILPPSQPKATPDLMFKDLKARVHKLFGADEHGKPLTPKEKLLRSLGHINPKHSGSSTSQNFTNQLQPTSGNNFNDGFNSKKNFQVNAVESDLRGLSENLSNQDYAKNTGSDIFNKPTLPVPPSNTKVSFCDAPRSAFNKNLFPVVASSSSKHFTVQNPERPAMNDVKKTLAQRLASVLVKVGMVDVPAPLLQEMLMKIGAFSSCPPQDIRESEILAILKRLGYV